MANYKVNEITDKKIWEEFLMSFNPHSFLQSWNWGEVNSFLGHTIFRLGFYLDDTLIGVCLVVYEQAKRGPHFVIPSGPVIDWNDVNLVKFVFNHLKNLAKKEKAWFIRMRPELEDTSDNKLLLEKQKFLNAPMHLHGENTLVVDITKPESEILASMRKNTRYAIRKSLKEGYTLDVSTDPSDARVLNDLQKETVKRHKFVGFRKELFEKEIELFGKDGMGALLTCKKDGTPLVTAIVIFYGDYAYYHHSGSTNEARHSNASYFTQWQIILEAKRRGCLFYDLWGISPNDNPRHRFAGVTTFKKGFGGYRFNWIHAHDLPVSSLYFLTYTFETIRRIIRRL